uniref:Uncharacterized protein n=1 Tax=Plectus sambesii TaxID=2011161 RepID=A0A914XIR5_9BILA
MGLARNRNGVLFVPLRALGQQAANETGEARRGRAADHPLTTCRHTPPPPPPPPPPLRSLSVSSFARARQSSSSTTVRGMRLGPFAPSLHCCQSAGLTWPSASAVDTSAATVVAIAGHVESVVETGSSTTAAVGPAARPRPHPTYPNRPSDQPLHVSDGRSRSKRAEDIDTASGLVSVAH